MRVLMYLVATLAALSCQSAPQGAGPRVATSLMGAPLHRPPMDSATRARLVADVERAQQDLLRRPEDPDAVIWLARRYGYLGEYQLAVATLSGGIRQFPDDPRMLRHRGHRYITLRRFDEAIDDLTRAGNMMAGMPEQIEPDGQPNARNIPIGSLQSNVWYHLALAHYLQGNWEAAAAIARRGIETSTNPDRLVSQTHWLYMALRRARMDSAAHAALEAIRDDFDIVENHSYYELVKLYRTGITPALMDSTMRRLENPSDLSYAYGVANWFLYNGDTTRAVRAFERILKSSQWTSFGYIAAEADLARIRFRRLTAPQR